MEDIVLQSFEKDGVIYDLVVPAEVKEQAQSGESNVAYSPVVRAHLAESEPVAAPTEPVNPPE